MGVVLAFAAPAFNPHKLHRPAVHEGDAQILFFTGVRYERRETPKDYDGDRPSRGASGNAVKAGKAKVRRD